MVEVELKLSPKGQMVIPKILRDEYELAGRVLAHDAPEGILLTRPRKSFVELCEELVKRVKKPRIPQHPADEMAWERWKKK